MKRIYVKLSALIIAIITAVSTVSFSSVNAESEGLYEYRISGDGAAIIECSPDASGSVTVPSVLGGYPVCSIESCAFMGCDKITEIVLPKGVTTIDDSAFYGCTALKSAVIQEGVTAIWYSAFSDCTSLVSVTIPHSTDIIFNDVFEGCGDHLTIYGYSGTEAETFARENNIAFSSLGSVEKAHEWGEWTVLRQPTELKRGRERRICTSCSLYEDRYIRPNTPYGDLPEGKWYSEPCLFCVERGYMSGTGKTVFSPDTTLTRAQFVQILAKVTGADLSTVRYINKFSDIPENKWYTKAVCWAIDFGITGGIGDGMFGPDNYVSRAQLATFLCAYAEKTGLGDDSTADISSYSDYSDIPQWAKPAMSWAVESGLIGGTDKSHLSPNITAARAQTAVMIKNLIDLKNCLGNVMIFGDSISTFEGYIPEEYPAFYPHAAENSVKHVEDTWWKLLLDETNSSLVMNDSWSGSTLAYSLIGAEQSFLFREMKHLADGKFDGKKIDTVLIFGGTNDSTARIPAGEPKYSDWTEDDYYSFDPAFCKMIDHIRTTAPDIRIINIIGCHVNKPIADGMEEICEHYGVECVRLKDIENIGVHPTKLGMIRIKDQILDCIAER